MLSVEGKVRVMWRTENGKQKPDVCREFGLVNSTIQMIWQTTAKIISVLERQGMRIKQFRKSKLSYVDEALLKLFKQERSGNVPVSGPHQMITFFLLKY